MRAFLPKKSAARELPQTADDLTFAQSVFSYQVVDVSTFVSLQLQPWQMLHIYPKAEYLLCDLPTFTTAFAFLLLFCFHNQSIFNH